MATDKCWRQRLDPSSVTAVPPLVEIDEGAAEVTKLPPCSSEKEAARPEKTWAYVLQIIHSDGAIIWHIKREYNVKTTPAFFAQMNSRIHQLTQYCC